MATTQLIDIIEPAKFTDYILQNSMERTALVQAGILARNAVIEAQLNAGADSFTVPFWNDLADDEADIVNDNPATNSTPGKLTAGKQVVRKSFLHKSWSSMNLASEIAGADALGRIQSRAGAYWDRQLQRRLVGTMNGILADNVASDDGDMLLDISGETGDAAKFSAAAVIDAAGTLGDQLGSITGIAMHGDLYRAALKADLIEFVRPSEGSLTLPTFRGLVVIQDDAMPKDDVAGTYVTALFGVGAFGYGVSAPRIAAGTEVENLPSSGNGGGQQILHSRLNVAVHPAGFKWTETSVVDESPSLAELAAAANWARVVERRAVPLAFLKSKL
ncbi:hypothetical protein [Marinobacter sp.]|uniref:hypothetical protein n=1 Tax=Marinobacter sp. TaxID=50741 RepID=UPI0019FD9873|nr:hypothetical protein [Marinobacter sp.]MBE0487379.1 hypothetical protein [Marinobacter sp.]